MESKSIKTSGPRRLAPLLVVLAGVAGGVILFSLLYQSYRQPDPEQGNSRVTVEGNAMEPGLLAGSTVEFRPMASYQRGVVVWLNDPETGPRVRHIGRIVAVGGDKVEWANGAFYLNGQMVNEPYAKDAQNIQNLGPLVVPAGQFFVLNDNRAIGPDSRKWGAVGSRLIRGALIKK